MQRYNIRFSQTWKTVVAIMSPAFLFVPAVIFFPLYGRHLGAWTTYTMVFLLALGLLMGMYLVTKSNPKAMLTIDDDGFSIDFLQKNFYIPTSFEVKSDQVRKHSFETNNGSCYISFKTSASPSNFMISPADNSQEEQESFLKLSKALIEHNNKTS